VNKQFYTKKRPCVLLPLNEEEGERNRQVFHQKNVCSIIEPSYLGREKRRKCLCFVAQRCSSGHPKRNWTGFRQWKKYEQATRMCCFMVPSTNRTYKTKLTYLRIAQARSSKKGLPRCGTMLLMESSGNTSNAGV
jgi:hypothetical protein